MQGYGLCRCEDPWTGASCGRRPSPGQPRWALLFDLERSLGAAQGLPRVQLGHSLLAREPSQLWLFGGTWPGGAPSDALHVYDLDFNRWKEVGRPTSPSTTAQGLVGLWRASRARPFLSSEKRFHRT